MNELKSIAFNGWWKKIWPEAVNYFQGFHNSQNRMWNLLMLAC